VDVLNSYLYFTDKIIYQVKVLPLLKRNHVERLLRTVTQRYWKAAYTHSER
jgi:hypothetical protein